MATVPARAMVVLQLSAIGERKARLGIEAVAPLHRYSGLERCAIEALGHENRGTALARMQDRKGLETQFAQRRGYPLPVDTRRLAMREVFAAGRKARSLKAVVSGAGGGCAGGGGCCKGSQGLGGVCRIGLAGRGTKAGCHTTECHRNRGLGEPTYNPGAETQAARALPWDLIGGTRVHACNMSTSRRSSGDYAESSIRVLRGLEPVRQRPGMYTRTDHPLHIIQEVIDNAADEALAGYCSAIEVTLHADGSVAVLDNGRGIPVGLHPEEGVPTVELVFTRLHAGGKFDKQASGAYSFSGGLHGVGVSVTNALSKRLEVSVWRDGVEHALAFAQGEVAEPLRIVGPVARQRRGTRVRVWPEPRYFDALQYPLQDMEQLLRSKAVLLPGLQTSLREERSGRLQQWHYAGGLRAYLEESIAAASGQAWLFPPFEGVQAIDTGHESFAEGEGVQWVIGFTEEGACVRESYVNLIPTPAGGTHESGLREGMFQAVKTFVELHALLPKGLRLLPEDVFSRASFVLSAKVLDPQFQGQVKERLTSRDALRLTASLLKPAMDLWLNEHVEWGRRLADMVIRQAQVRQRA